MSIPNKKNQMTVTDGKSISTYNDSGTSLYKVNQKKCLKMYLRNYKNNVTLCDTRVNSMHNSSVCVI